MVATAPFGTMLKAWRKRRRMTQADLSHDAEISTKHVSFLETGRAKPSRLMVLVLASALEMPLRERNRLLHVAGFAPAYAPSLSDPELARVRDSLCFLLRWHAPFAAMVVDPYWNLLLANEGYVRMLSWLSGAPIPLTAPDGIYDQPPLAGVNVLQQLLDRDAAGRFLVNFDEVAADLLAWVARDARTDPHAEELLRTLRAKPGLADLTWSVDQGVPTLLPLVFEKDGQRVSLFSTLTTLGSPVDAQLRELRIETFFPADPSSEAFLKGLAEGERADAALPAG